MDLLFDRNRVPLEALVRKSSPIAMVKKEEPAEPQVGSVRLSSYLHLMGLVVYIPSLGQTRQYMLTSPWGSVQCTTPVWSISSQISLAFCLSSYLCSMTSRHAQLLPRRGCCHALLPIVKLCPFQ